MSHEIEVRQAFIDSISSNAFNIGDKVCSKETGFPGVGTVVGIMPLKLGLALKMIPQQAPSVWSQILGIELDGTENVYIVMYLEERNTFSIDDLRVQHPDASNVELEVILKHSRKTNIISYLECDLEHFV